MTNPLFEFMAATLALLPAIAAMMLGAFTDRVAASLYESRNRRESFSFPFLGGLMAATAAYIAFSRSDSLRILLLFAAVHGSIFGCWSLFSAARIRHDGMGVAASILIGLGSLLFAAGFAWTSPIDAHRAVMLLGAYSSFVGVKLGYRALQMASGGTHRNSSPKVRFV